MAAKIVSIDTHQDSPSVMIDCETLGLTPNAPLLSIGALLFYPYKADLLQQSNEEIRQSETTLYINIDIEDEMLHNFRFDIGTIRWWFHKSREKARQHINETDSMMTLTEAMVQLFSYCYSQKITNIWSRGINDVFWINYAGRVATELSSRDPSSSIHLLTEEQQTQIYQDKFIDYYQWRDCRVLDPFVIPAILKNYADETNPDKHNALDDAINQARCVQSAYQALVS